MPKRQPGRCAVCMRAVTLSARTGWPYPHRWRGAPCPGSKKAALEVTLAGRGSATRHRAAFDARAAGRQLHANQVNLQRKFSANAISRTTVEVRAASHFQNPAASLASSITHALTAPAIAPARILDASGKLIALMDPSTRVRTPV